MTSLTRYTCYYRDPFGDSGPALSERDSGGEWVRHEEAQAEIDRLREALASLRLGLVLDLRYADDDDDKDALRSRVKTVEEALA